MHPRSIGKHRHPGTLEKLIAQPQSIAYYLRKLRIECRLPVSGERNGVYMHSLPFESGEFVFKGAANVNTGCAMGVFHPHSQ